jgi:uncharacterized protein
MKIGLLSDTHNHLPETRQALDLLLQHGAEHLVHCGDVGEDVLDLISAACMEHNIRAHVAFGNCDSRADQAFLPQPFGVERGTCLEWEMEGRRCAVLHGDQARPFAQTIESGQLDYIFTGHTHRAEDRRIGRTRILNPGSPVRPRGGPPSVAILDLSTDAVSFLTLSG